MSFEKVAKIGRIYSDASECYSPGTRVMCDRCKRTDLKRFAHLDDVDLCVDCVDTMRNLLSQEEKLMGARSLMMQSMMTNRFRKTRMKQKCLIPQQESSRLCSRIEQNSLRDDDRCVSYMCQDMFNPVYQ